MDWMSNYRNHQEPSRVPAAVHAMQDFGLFADEEKAWFCTGFIAGVLGSNPKDGPSLIPRMFPMPDKEQAVIIRAIAYSGRPDWRDLLEKTSSRMPLRRPLIDDFLAGKRPDADGASARPRRLAGHLRAVGLLRRHRPTRAGGSHHAGAALVEEQGRQRLFLPQGVLRLGSDPSAVEKITTGGTAKWTLASYAERDRELLALYRAEYARQPQDIAKPLKDVIDAAEIFESEKMRKDQFGAIEDAQKAQMTNEAGMSKGRDSRLDRHRHRLRGGDRAGAGLYRPALRARRRALYRRRQARALSASATRCRGG